MRTKPDISEIGGAFSETGASTDTCSVPGFHLTRESRVLTGEWEFRLTTPEPTIKIELRSGVASAAGQLDETSFTKVRQARTLTVLGRASELRGVARGNGPHDMLIVRLDASVSERFPEYPVIDLRSAANVIDSTLQDAGAQLGSAMEDSDTLLIESICCRLSESLLAQYGFCTTRHVPRHVPLTRNQLRVVIDRLETDDGDITVHALASLCDLSDHYFITAFRNSLHVTPHQYLLRKRLQRSMRLLANSSLSIDDVAGIVGFSSQSHFTSRFRAAVGETPLRYRRRMMSGRSFSARP